jgi:Pretoxin HINT domain
VCGATSNAPAPASGTAPADPQVLSDAVAVALRCELDGNDVDRNALLQHVLDEDPEFAPAHWHLGDLKVNGAKWVLYEQFVDEEDERWHRLYLYRKNRDRRADTVHDHFYMADGAHDRGMWDEERAHLMRIVELDWDNEEARARLGDVKVNGFWVAREEIEQFARNLFRIRRDLDAWGPDVNRIVRRLARSRGAAWDATWAELTAIRDPSAIPAVERALASSGEPAALSYLDWLRGLDAWEASVALARQAVFSPSAAVRSKAQELLQERRIDDYVPVLLGAMRADVNFQSRLFVNEFGALVYTEQIAYETQTEVRRRNLAVLYGPENRAFNSLSAMLDTELPLANMPEVRDLALAHLLKQYQTFSPRQGRIGQSLTEVGNDRASRTLVAAMQIPEYDSPHEWWDWWNDYQQVYVFGRKREVEENYGEIWTLDQARSQFRRTPQRVVFGPTGSGFGRTGGCCFAAGTLVVTEYGPKPIEEVVLGDRVLAQDIESGQIAFKPVFKVTVRPPVGLLTVTTNDAELACVGGHPFWINGLGWRYAWELEPGMRLHSVDGSSEIISVEDSGRRETAYNLVVADYHNYFVGDDFILAHDNSPRDPTNALVPGLMPDWSAPPVK